MNSGTQNEVLTPFNSHFQTYFLTKLDMGGFDHFAKNILTDLTLSLKTPFFI